MNCEHAGDLLTLRLQDCGENDAFLLLLAYFTNTHVRTVVDVNFDAAESVIAFNFELNFVFHLFKQKSCFELGCVAQNLYVIIRVLDQCLMFDLSCYLFGVDMLPNCFEN
jgi:hypothetical protein